MKNGCVNFPLYHGNLEQIKERRVDKCKFRFYGKILTILYFYAIIFLKIACYLYDLRKCSFCCRAEWCVGSAIPEILITVSGNYPVNIVAVFQIPVHIPLVCRVAVYQPSGRKGNGQPDNIDHRVNPVAGKLAYYEFKILLKHGYSVLRVSIGFWRAAFRVCQVVMARTTKTEVRKTNMNNPAWISTL